MDKVVYEFINQINNMDYNENILKEILETLPQGWILKEETNRPLELENLWVVYDENGELKIDIFVEDDPIEIGEFMISAEIYTKVE